ncbi:MAG TPA: hypothetical protein VGP75_11425 [Yoonia sp.]|nr:hypothetical protein [Yoonia sp.]
MNRSRPQFKHNLSAARITVNWPAYLAGGERIPIGSSKQSLPPIWTPNNARRILKDSIQINPKPLKDGAGVQHVVNIKRHRPA